MTETVFGPLVSRGDIQQAVISVLQTWITTYLAERERQAGLAPKTLPVPPGPSSFRGGIDANTFMSEWFPVLHVLVAPDGPPIREGGGEYGQAFRVEVAVTLGNDDEDRAITFADHYGMAIAGAVAQGGDRGGLSQKIAGVSSATATISQTLVLGMPEVAFVDPEVRQVARSVTTFRIYVQPVLIESDGPATPPFDPYVGPGDWPTIGTVTTTVAAIPTTQNLPD